MSTMFHAPDYFDALNYTLANEDSALEHALLASNADVVVAVAGSGARVLPLIAKAPAEVVCVDVSPAQLRLTELRIETVRALSRDQFLDFWGYPNETGPRPITGVDRVRMLDALELSTEARAFAHGLLAPCGDRAPIYAGRWERALAKLTQIARAVLGAHIDELFAFDDLEEQRAYLASRFPWHRFRIVVAALGGATVFNALLYGGKFPKKNTPGSAARFYLDVFRKLFAQGLARQNWFLQLVLLGELRFSEGNPIECRSDVFAAMKRALLCGTRARYVTGDILDVTASLGKRVDFVSLSDVPSYLAPERARELLAIVAPGLRAGARVVSRYYLRVPHVDRRGFAMERFDDVVVAEKVGVYDVAIYAAPPARALRVAA